MTRTCGELEAEVGELRRRLEEAEGTISAIRGTALFPEQNPSPVLRVKSDGELLFANRASTAVLIQWRCAVGAHVPADVRQVVKAALDMASRQLWETRCAGRDLLFDVVPISHAGYVNCYAHDVTEQRRAEQEGRANESRRRLNEAVRAERQRLNDVLDLLPAYVALLAPDYHVPFANRFFEDRFGKSAGRRCYEYLFHRTAPCENCETFKVLKTGAPHHWGWVGPDGRSYDIHDFPFTDADGSPLIMEVGVDVTEQKRAEAALLEAHEALERRADQLQMLAAELTQAEQRERRRLAQVLHDHLQQLLYAARLSVGSVSYRIHDQEMQEPLRQIDDLLYQSIEASRLLTMELSPPILYEGGLAAALEWLGQHMREAFGLEVELELDAEIEVAAEDMRILLFQAVRELLFNVIKHAKVPCAQVTLTRLDSRQIRIVVADEGAGFVPVKLEGEGVRPAGFGLFAMRERLELVDGHVEVNSAPGGGTRVAIVVPCPRHEQSTCHEGEPAIPGDATTPKKTGLLHRTAKTRVLLADDHRVLREGLARLFREQPDLELVAEAADGRQAVELALRTEPDVVVMDVSMPVLSGIEATRRLVAALPGVRVIALSMHEKEDMAGDMFEAGAVAYLPKGGSAEPLIAAIRGVPYRQGDENDQQQ